MQYQIIARMKQLILLLFLLISLFTFSAVKHTLSGTITDAATGESLIGTAVTVAELPGMGATTNGYGYFSLTLPDGKYRILVSYMGYKPYSEIIDLSANKLLALKLEPNTQQLDEVEITAVRKNNNIVSSEMGVEKLEMKEISKIPVLFGEADIMKTLKLMPGIKSVGEGSGGMYVRGGNSSGTSCGWWHRTYFVAFKCRRSNRERQKFISGVGEANLC